MSMFISLQSGGSFSDTVQRTMQQAGTLAHLSIAVDILLHPVTSFITHSARLSWSGAAEANYEQNSPPVTGRK